MSNERRLKLLEDTQNSGLDNIIIIIRFVFLNIYQLYNVMRIIFCLNKLNFYVLTKRLIKLK